MSREIKFRAWLIDEKRMVTDRQDFIPLRVSHFGLERLNPTMNSNHWSIVDTPVELMQYTGLKDKNGKEVYEGDLVDDKFGVGQIKEIRWNEKTACFCYYCKGLDFSWDGLSDTIIHGEVIGNIHENKELLDNAK